MNEIKENEIITSPEEEMEKNISGKLGKKWKIEIIINTVVAVLAFVITCYRWYNGRK